MSSVVGGVRNVRRGLVAVGVLATGLAVGIAVAASGQTTGTGTGTATGTGTGTGTDTTTTGGGSNSVIDLGHDGRVVFVAFVVGLFAALWFLLIWYDRRKVNQRIAQLLSALIKNAEGPSDARLTVAEMRALSSAAVTKGATGLTRTTIALGLLTLVAVALAALLVGDGDNASDLLKTVVTALTTALTTVIGFYFGAKTTADAAAQGGAAGGGAGEPANPPKPPGAPTITSVTAGAGQVTVDFTAPAETGGSKITGYTVTSPEAADVKATGTESPITVEQLTAGKTYTFAVSATNAAGEGPKSAVSDKASPT